MPEKDGKDNAYWTVGIAKWINYYRKIDAIERGVNVDVGRGNVRKDEGGHSSMNPFDGEKEGSNPFEEGSSVSGSYEGSGSLRDGEYDRIVENRGSERIDIKKDEKRRSVEMKPIASSPLRDDGRGGASVRILKLNKGMHRNEKRPGGFSRYNTVKDDDLRSALREKNDYISALKQEIDSLKDKLSHAEGKIAYYARKEKNEGDSLNSMSFF